MMEQLNIGTIGAKVQSWKARNPRDLLKSVIDENPGAHRPAIFRLFRDRLRDEDDADDYVQTIIEYWLANNYHSLVDPQPARRERRDPVPVTRAATAIRTRVTQKIKQSAQIALLDMAMPNGKQLKDCTGKECKQLSQRIGDWLWNVASRVKAQQTVGEILTEQDLQAIY